MVFSKKSGVVFFSILFFAANSQAANLQLESSDIHEGETLPMKQVADTMGCKGENLSPGLRWNDPPEGTKSFALTVYDPDAPTGSGWWHWVVYNIPVTTRVLDEGAGSSDGANLPKGTVQGKNDAGKKGFGGACPPVGDKPHHYIFTLFALKTDSLTLPADASPPMVGFMLNKNAIAKSTITAVYSRNQ